MTSKRSPAIPLLLFASAAALLGGVVLGFLYLETKAARFAADGITDGIGAAQRRDVINRGVKTILAETQHERAALTEYFLAPQGAPAFLEEVEHLGELAKVDLTIPSVSEGDGTMASLQEVRMTIRTVGSWPRTVHFLSLIDGLSRAHVLEGVSLEREGDAWNLLVRLTVLRRVAL